MLPIWWSELRQLNSMKSRLFHHRSIYFFIGKITFKWVDYSIYTLVLIPQLLILDFWEKLSFCGFAQEILSKLVCSRIAIIVISMLFAIANLSAGPADIVMYAIGLILIVSILNGILFCLYVDFEMSNITTVIGKMSRKFIKVCSKKCWLLHF